PSTRPRFPSTRCLRLVPPHVPRNRVTTPRTSRIRIREVSRDTRGYERSETCAGTRCAGRDSLNAMRWVFVSMVLALALVAATAHAQTATAPSQKTTAAKPLVAAGTTAYRAGNFGAAVAAFEQAFRLDPSPENAFNLGQADRNQYFIDRDILHLHRALAM